MPVYKFTSNGKTIKVTGDTPPSESELDDIFKAAGVSTDVGSSTTVPETPSVAQLASAKTPAERIAALKDTPVGGDLQKVLSLARLWATNGPHAVVQGIKDFMGGDYAKGAHEALSGAGITALPMVAGPAVMAAAGAPVTAAATLAGGYAGGKLAPMAAEELGATPDQAALAGDVGMVAGGAAGGRLLQMPMPSGQQAAQAALKALRFARHPVRETAKTVADAILARTETPSGPVSTAGYPRAGTTPAPPTGEPPAHLDLSQRVPAGGLTKEQIGERLAAAQKQGMNAPAYESPQNPATPVREPLPPRAAAPVPEGPPEPSMAKPAAPSKSPQQILNEEAIAKRRAAYQESLKADAKPVLEDVEAGKMTAEQAAAELAKRWGTPSDAERRFPPNKSGLPSNPPTARKARGKVSDLADMPIEPPKQVEPAAPSQPETGKLSSLQTETPSKPQPSDLESVSERIRKESGGKLAVMDLRRKNSGDVELETIAVSPRGGGEGVATKAMESLVRWADENGERLILSPSEKGYQPVAGGPKTTSTARLKDFYKRFGFVEPKGRNYDPTISSPTRPVMFRKPNTR
jgi:GNAT superfamily N-acetyltransferase